MLKRLILAWQVIRHTSSVKRNKDICQIEILNKLGQERSITERQSVDESGNPLPWFTYPSIEYLSQLDLSKFDVLEWGSGNSTLYFSKRVKSILSIEHDREWYEKIKNSFYGNISYVLAENQDYIDYPRKQDKKYDLIIVDGINRYECLMQALTLIKDSGIIIYDNSDRHPEHCAILRKYGLIQIDFHGFGPIVRFTTTTSFFLKRNVNIMPIDKQPKIPVGGGY